MTLTIFEGQHLKKVVRETGRILGVGSQQRSDATFQHAVKLVQDGTLRKISKVNAYVGAPPTPYNLPEEPIPADLNWDLWLASLPSTIHFNNQLNPPISLDPPKDEEIWGAWRWYKEMGGGFTTDWGAHMFDIAQWGLGMDKNGPVEISPIGDGSEFISWKYANGVVMTSETFDEKKTKGVKFFGENGWIEVSRGYFNASDPKFNPPRARLDPALKEIRGEMDVVWRNASGKPVDEIYLHLYLNAFRDKDSTFMREGLSAPIPTTPLARPASGRSTAAGPWYSSRKSAT